MLSLTICSYYCYNLLLVLIIIMISLPCRTNSEIENFLCSTQYSCGNGLSMYYPFWSSGTPDGSHCGYPGFRFYCHYQLYGRPVLNISSNLYYIEEFNQGSSILIINLDFHEKSCPRPRRNLTVDHAFNPFMVDKSSSNFTYFFNCTSKPPYASLPSENEIGFSYSNFHVGCLDYNDTIRSYAFRAEFINPKILEWSWKNCEENVVVPVLSDNSKIRFMESNTLERGFRVTWSTPIGCESCEKDGGLCVYDEMKRNFNCTYCELGKYKFNQSQGQGGGYDCVPPDHSPFSGGAIAGAVGLTKEVLFRLLLIILFL